MVVLVQVEHASGRRAHLAVILVQHQGGPEAQRMLDAGTGDRRGAGDGLVIGEHAAQARLSAGTEVTALAVIGADADDE